MKAAPLYFAVVLWLLAFACPTIAEETSAPRAPAIAAALKPFVDRNELAGAVLLVANKNRVLCVDAVGFADIAGRKDMPTDAMFWIASQTKPITGAALMMLVDEGKVDIDDPVEKYLPEFRGLWLAVEQDAEHMLLRKPSHPITVRNVLSHTSGLPKTSAMETPTLDQLRLLDAARSYAMTPLMFEPDTAYAYSNAGINTAGRIIEVVSGMPYEEFLQKRLFDPLGMRDTTFWPNERQLARLAKSYKPSSADDGLEETTITQLKYPLDDRQRQPMPAGGLFSTADDLARFCQMVLSGGTFHGERFLSEAAVKQMTSRHTPAALRQSYGLGWSTQGETFGHGGAYSTQMTIDPASGLITILLVQHAGFPSGVQKADLIQAFEAAASEAFGDRQ